MKKFLFTSFLMAAVFLGTADAYAHGYSYRRDHYKTRAVKYGFHIFHDIVYEKCGRRHHRHRYHAKHRRPRICKAAHRNYGKHSHDKLGCYRR